MTEFEDGSLFFADGGDVTPMFTSNPNDPRLQRYNDSLGLYNAYKFAKDTQLKNLKASINRNRPSFSTQSDFNQWRNAKLNEFGKVDRSAPSSGREEFNRAATVREDYLPEEQPIINYFNKIAKGNKNFRISQHSSPDLWHKNINPIGTYYDDIAYSPVYKKPVQPVLYKQESIQNTPSTTLPPIFTSNRNDPRLRNYNDSLAILKAPFESYKIEQTYENLLKAGKTKEAQKIHTKDRYQIPSIQAYERLTSLNRKEPDPIKGSNIGMGLKPSDKNSPRYKEPVQPVIYKPETAVQDEIPMVTLPEINVSASNKVEPQTTTPQNMSLPPKWYSYQGPEKGILVDNKYMSTEEFDKYVQQNPNFRYAAQPNSVGYVYRPGQGIVRYEDGGTFDFVRNQSPNPTTNFEKRFYNTYNKMQNPDGSFSSHKMMSWSDDQGYYAAPTIVEQNGKLKELDPNEAMDYAYKTNEYKKFNSPEEAEAYANNGYKANTPLEVFVNRNPEYKQEYSKGGMTFLENGGLFFNFDKNNINI